LCHQPLSSYSSVSCSQSLLPSKTRELLSQQTLETEMLAYSAPSIALKSLLS
jgi:hypothetical protein